MNNKTEIRTTSELIKEGYLVPPKFFCPPVEIDLHAILEGKTGVDANIVDTYRSLCPGKKTIVFCSTVEHAEVTAGRFNAAGVTAVTVLGSQNHAEREVNIERFRCADLDGTTPVMVLVTVSVLLESNWPEVDAVIIAAPTRSKTKFHKQVATAMTPRHVPSGQLRGYQRAAIIAASDKPQAIILDVAGNVERLGVPFS